MIRSYLQTAGRILRRRSGYIVLNVLGLSVGIASFCIIAGYILGELSYSFPIVQGYPPAEGDIVGTWDLVAAQGGIDGRTLTQESESWHTVEIRFREDQTFSMYRADTLFVSGSYTLERAERDVFLYYDPAIDLNMFNQFVEISARRDTLILLDFCCDGFKKLYRRLE